MTASAGDSVSANKEIIGAEIEARKKASQTGKGELHGVIHFVAFICFCF